MGSTIARKYGSEKVSKAAQWSREAGTIALRTFRDSTPETKDDDSYVTEADREIESFLRDQIQSHYPDDRVVGEEEATTEGGGDSWYLDPIDGTAAYATDLPIWAVSIGIWSGTQAVCGVLNAPFMDELYVDSGSRVHKNGDELAEPQHDEWNRETLLCVPSDTHRRYQIDFPGKTRCLGSTAYHMAMVLDGRAVGALIGRTRIWDIAAVVGMGQRLNLETRGIFSGGSIDFQGMLTGDRPEEPMLFCPSEEMEELINRVSLES